MAKPENPLDRFASYTYHFELHAAGTDSELHRMIKLKEILQMELF